MLIECGVSLYAAAAAHSPSLLAFGSDSLVELLSAAVVLLRYGSPNQFPSEVRRASPELCSSFLRCGRIHGFALVGSSLQS